jgi:hypothetical protein
MFYKESRLGFLQSQKDCSFKDHPEYCHHCPINTSEGLNAGPIASLNIIGTIYMESLRKLGSTFYKTSGLQERN